VPLAQPADARVDVATEIVHVQVRTHRFHLRGTAQAGGAHAGARGQGLEPLARVREQRVARIGPLQVGAERQAAGQRGGHVLEAVHGQVDLAGQHRLFDLLQEGALAADAFQAPIEHLVAGGGDLLELDLVAAGDEEVLHVLGLPKGQ